MAKLTRIPPATPEETYVLELTRAEAQLVRTMVGSLSGSGRVRELSNKIYYAMIDEFPTRRTDVVLSYVSDETGTRKAAEPAR